MGSNARLERQQSSLAWDPEMEEATEQPPHLILLDPSFLVYRRRQRKLISGKVGTLQTVLGNGEGI
jgi:hypothetical protein